MPGGPTNAPTTKRRGGRGRPSSLTAETLQEIERTLLNLGSYDDAAIAGGIHPRTFERWLAKGEREAAESRSTDHANFYRLVVGANRKIKALLTGRVLHGSRSDPYLALKILQSRFVEWAPRSRIVDETPPAPKASPRERLLARIAAIEERTAQTLATLDARDRGEGQPSGE